MNPFDIEQQLLAHVIHYSNEPFVKEHIGQLTPEKFVFNSRGDFGGDHSLIWAGVRNAYLIDKLPPSLDIVENYVPEVGYIRSLSRPVNFDPDLFKTLVDLVDKQGLVYNVSKYGYALGNNIASTETFLNTLNSVQDIELWVTDQLTKLRSNVSIQSEGYEHISVVSDRVKQYWDDLRSGKKTAYIDSGIPSLKNNYLFPAGELAVIHGESGGGKSTFVFQVQMGTAIGLYLNDKPGCVAVNSLEMTSESLVERLAGILAHVDLTTLKTGKMDTTDYNRLCEWLEFVQVLPIFVDDTSFLTTSAMQYRASGLHVSEHGPVVQISSDYGELFRIEDSQLTKEQRVDKVFREQFQLSRSIGASVLAISQSTVDAAVSGKSHIAGVDGTRYSRGIRHSADVICELWNPEQIKKNGGVIAGIEGGKLNEYNPFLLIQKRRSGAIGEQIEFGWNASHTTFFDKTLQQVPNKETLYTTLDAAYNKWKGNNTRTW